MSSQRERFDLGHCKSATDGNENWTLWKPWLQCWGVMCKLWNEWLGWNLEELSSAIAQSPVPAISITAHPNSTSLLVLIQHKLTFSSELFVKCLPIENVRQYTKKSDKEFPLLQDKCKVKT